MELLTGADAKSWRTVSYVLLIMACSSSLQHAAPSFQEFQLLRGSRITSINHFFKV